MILDNLREIPDGVTLVCLGDISVRCDDEAVQRLGELKREKSLRMILVPGNHARVHPMCGMDSVACVADAYSADGGGVCGGGSASDGQAGPVGGSCRGLSACCMGKHIRMWRFGARM